MKDFVGKPWEELKTKFEPVLYLSAKDWNPFTLYDLKPNESKKFGVWTYHHHVLPARERLDTFQNSRAGIVRWDGEVVIPRVADKYGHTWMSYTPMEIFTQRSGLRMAKGNVFIGGLGMGWLANRVAARAQVKKVVVVEREDDIIKLAKPAVQSPKIHVVKGDAWEEARKYSVDEWVFLFDTWRSYGDNNEEPETVAFKKDRPSAKVWCWGGGPGPQRSSYMGLWF
jgi:hypothetical protein